MRRLLIIALAMVALIALAVPLRSVATTTPTWTLKYSTNFPTNAPLGAFSNCDNNANTPQAFCSGLAPYGTLESQFWAFPSGKGDTATTRGLPVHGYYQPQNTVSISGGEMHINIFRNSAGNVESAAVLPLSALGVTYGKFVETFNVSQTSPGFKAVNVLWPLAQTGCCEEDFPEADLDGTAIQMANSHIGSIGGSPAQAHFSTGAPYSSTFHSYTITWKPGSVSFYFDGKQIGRVTANIPSQPERWVLQNECAIDSENGAAPIGGAGVQINISHIAVYSYNG